MGYLAKRKKEKRSSFFTYFSLIFLAVLSLSGIFFKGSFLSNFLDEFRYQYIFLTSIMVLYSLATLRFGIMLIFAAIALFNVSVIVSQNQILAKEYAGKNPASFTLMLHKLEKKETDIENIKKLLSKKNPDITVLFMNGNTVASLEGILEKNNRSEKLAEGQEIVLLSKKTYEEKVDITDDNGNKIATLLYFTSFQKPFSIIITDINEKFSSQTFADTKGKIRHIMEIMNLRDEPVIFVGGFTFSPWSNIFSDLRKDNFKTQAGLHPEYPSYLPFFLRKSRNYAFTHPGTSVIEMENLKNSSFVYMPVLMTIAIDIKKSR